MGAYTVATDWKPIDRIGLNQAIGTTSTTKLHDLGDRVVAQSATYGKGEFIYLTGVKDVVAGSVCLITDAYAVTLAAAKDKGSIAVATAAIVASNYGWFQIKGKAVCVTANGQSVTTATPVFLAGSGAVDDAAVAGDCVLGARFASAADTNTAIVNLGTNPCVGDFDNA